MARIKLEIPNDIIFTCKIDIRIYDINYGNHLGHDRLISILHDARTQLLTKMGFTELNIDGVGIIVSDLAVQYLNEAKLGDQLFISISIDEIKRKSFELYYRVLNKKNLEIAKAKTGIVCFDYENNRSISIPKIFIIELKKLLKSK
jgi:acyl-CoA thioester hydrolase